jgi:tRNA pseudouridine32 synthase/23S rRNA pseudouridine746 synthase/23S rRNA pseudouridine1911/1915/1917 synthase
MDLRNRVLYRDPLMLVLDKPAGVPVHAGPGGARSLEDDFARLRFGLPRDPALAHRLDRDTSGCLVLGRHRKALRKLGRLFANGRIEKIYWAVTRGRPARDEGRIEAPLRKRTERGSGWRMEIHAEGAAAVTDYRVLAANDGLAWLELRPRTGRTHQVRVHCASLGCPVVGDPVYGRETGIVPPLHLHARAVVVPLYASRDPIAVAAPPPAHMRAALHTFGWREGDGMKPKAESATVVRTRRMP